jgi:cob(I)alamin adenosyltransferase
MLKYMDGIIEELMFKIKEHLFLLRKELDIKMGMYYTSKPVDRIRSALAGLSKSLEERFLELRHD